MLSNVHADSMLLSTDLAATKAFYGDTLGLRLVYDGEQFVAFAAGHGSRVVVTHSTVGSHDQATKLSFRVDDLDAELDQLRERGVQVMNYEDLGTVAGVLDVGFARVAWFEDPSGNSLQLTEFRPGAIND